MLNWAICFPFMIGRGIFSFYNPFFGLYFLCLSLDMYYSVLLSRGLCVLVLSFVFS